MALLQALLAGGGWRRLGAAAVATATAEHGLRGGGVGASARESPALEAVELYGGSWGAVAEDESPAFCLVRWYGCGAQPARVFPDSSGAQGGGRTTRTGER